MNSAPADVGTANDTRWSVAGVFLETLARRDFAAMHACLDRSIRFRALDPGGPFEVHGAHDTVTRFRLWFDRHEVFEVIDASIGQLGSLLYLRWRILRAATAEGVDSRQVVEQHVFATVSDRIESFDLLSSGFNAEHPEPSLAGGGSCSPEVSLADRIGASDSGQMCTRPWGAVQVLQ